MKNKEKEIVYQSKDCEHKHLEKIAPLWYWCTDCGKIFMIPFTMQYSKEMAIEYLGGVMLTIKDKIDKIVGAEKKNEKRESDIEKKEIEKFERNEKIKNSKDDNPYNDLN